MKPRPRRLRDRALDVFALAVTALLIVALVVMGWLLIGPRMFAIVLGLSLVTMWAINRFVATLERWGVIS